jgi:hypothetical protein
MHEFCSCGAQLPPDALFCHKCGKPQREIAAPVPEGPVPAPTFVPPPAARKVALVGFRNPTALRVALLVGVGAMFFNFIPLLNWLAAGFFAVFFYRRRTRELLNVSAGVHMGWITGVIMFTVWGVFFTGLGLTGKLSSLFEEQLKNLPSNNDPYFHQMAQFLASGPGLMVVLAIGFVFITCLSMAGGALGAKMVGEK